MFKYESTTMPSRRGPDVADLYSTPQRPAAGLETCNSQVVPFCTHASMLRHEHRKNLADRLERKRRLAIE